MRGNRFAGNGINELEFNDVGRHDKIQISGMMI
jgi:hypothetical protein